MKLGLGVRAVSILVLVTVLLALIAGVVYFLAEQVQGIADAFRPNIDSKVVLAGTIEQLRAEGKVVVLTADVMAQVTSRTDTEILFGLLDPATTIVQVRAPARVQYVIPLDRINREDFFYDPTSKRLLITVPNPRLDTSIVQVSTDPADIEVMKDVGWMGLDRAGGRYNDRRARRLLRDAAIHAGQSGIWLRQAQESSDRALRRLFDPLISQLDDDVRVTFAFDDEDEPAGEGALPRPR